MAGREDLIVADATRQAVKCR